MDSQPERPEQPDQPHQPDMEVDVHSGGLVIQLDDEGLLEIKPEENSVKLYIPTTISYTLAEEPGIHHQCSSAQISRLTGPFAKVVRGASEEERLGIKYDFQIRPSLAERLAQVGSEILSGDTPDSGRDSGRDWDGECSTGRTLLDDTIMKLNYNLDEVTMNEGMGYEADKSRAEWRNGRAAEFQKKIMDELITRLEREVEDGTRGWIHHSVQYPRTHDILGQDGLGRDGEQSTLGGNSLRDYQLASLKKEIFAAGMTILNDTFWKMDLESNSDKYDLKATIRLDDGESEDVHLAQRAVIRVSLTCTHGGMSTEYLSSVPERSVQILRPNADGHSLKSLDFDNASDPGDFDHYSCSDPGDMCDVDDLSIPGDE